jgi:hypothetical protein
MVWCNRHTAKGQFVFSWTSLFILVLSLASASARKNRKADRERKNGDSGGDVSTFAVHLYPLLLSPDRN